MAQVVKSSNFPFCLKTLLYYGIFIHQITAFHSNLHHHSFRHEDRISDHALRLRNDSSIHSISLHYKANDDETDDITTNDARTTTKSSFKTFTHRVPKRPLTAPFPNGLNKGRLITLPPSLHFASSDQDMLPPRDVYVWLPPQYDEPSYQDTKFPVLYCHDGQNAIDDSSSWTGSSWRLAGALTRLSERNLLDTPQGVPPIVVMIPCCEDRMGLVIPRRHLEYGDVTSPFAQAHADLVGTVIRPLIDERFRTMGTKSGNAVMGSSLGGQASLHLALRHSDHFGKCACLSPAFQPGILSLVATVPQVTLDELTLYLDNGGDDDEQNVKVPLLDVQDHLTMQHWWNPGYWFLDSSLQMALDAMMLALDVRDAKYVYNKIAGGRHNERAWANRIDKPILALYRKNEA